MEEPMIVSPVVVTKQNLKWSDDMVKTLLEVRVGVLGAQFLGNNALPGSKFFGIRSISSLKCATKP